jgi:hypothetical protein
VSSAPQCSATVGGVACEELRTRHHARSCAFACGINAIWAVIGSAFDNKELAPVFSARAEAYGGAVLE